MKEALKNKPRRRCKVNRAARASLSGGEKKWNDRWIRLICCLSSVHNLIIKRRAVSTGCAGSYWLFSLTLHAETRHISLWKNVPFSHALCPRSEMDRGRSTLPVFQVKLEECLPFFLPPYRLSSVGELRPTLACIVWKIGKHPGEGY